MWSSRPTATPGWPARTTARISSPGTTRPSRSTWPSGRPTARRPSPSTTTTSWGGRRGNEEGLKGAFDPVIRDKELDADGVAADVLFADADAVTGMASPPFGAGLFAGAIEDPELAFAGARAHNRFLAEMCSHSPHRRGGIALVPITHDTV